MLRYFVAHIVPAVDILSVGFHVLVQKLRHLVQCWVEENILALFLILGKLSSFSIIKSKVKGVCVCLYVCECVSACKVINDLLLR